MFKNYFNIALRIALTNKVNFLISVGGLAIGFAACLLVTLYIVDELSYDRWVDGGENVYKIETSYYPKNLQPFRTSKSPYPVLSAVIEQVPNVSASVRLFDWDNRVRRNNQVFYEQITYAEKSFFDIFDLPVVKGVGAEALQSASNILVSESMALKYFGSENPIGQILAIDAFGQIVDYEVVGVLKDVPENSHFKLNFLTLFDEKKTVFSGIINEWYSAAVHSYIKFSTPQNDQLINRKVEHLAKNFISNDHLENVENIKINLIPLFDIHLHGDKEHQRDQNGSISAVYSALLAAILILLIASINFVNFSTARASLRTREVTIRKVMGASRKQLIIQFITESIVISFFAFLLAIVIGALALPWFNLLWEKSLTMVTLLDPILFFGSIVFVFVLAVIAGSYPAFVLSSLKPTTVLTANKSSPPGQSYVRNALVVVQFAVSAALIIGTAFFYMQMNYLYSVDKGFNESNKLTLFFGGQNKALADTFKQQLLSINGVKGAALSNSPFPRLSSSTINAQIAGNQESGRLISEQMFVDTEFFDLFEISAKSGRVFSTGQNDRVFIRPQENVRGQGDVVVNKEFLNKLGINSMEAAIGQVISTDDSDLKIIGVVEDLKLRSMHHAVRPMVFTLGTPNQLHIMTLDLDPAFTSTVLKQIDTIWRQVLPDQPISKKFVESEFEALYRTEDRQINILLVFSAVALFMAATGLYGMALFYVTRRQKEIGIRKVLGASVWELIWLLNWQFSKPVILGSFIGLIGGFWFIQGWLNSFALRIGVGEHIYIFILTIILTLLVATLSAFFQTRKVALSSPMEVLRYE
ncbi:ABC transporter permease [Paraneptunicella aestuarii]|uniref:ABC transporter permease n=1 Tax=Paraneptunicella aestuarii TaxID=2831148 RepID=UPI001E588BCC|nr:ABC transporter permease [Paraneptunicella aestuarii]UAA37214.1 ABC transporter permease [Paraneptunicella aestuarii]